MIAARPAPSTAPRPAASIPPAALALVAALSLGFWSGLAHLAMLL